MIRNGHSIARLQPVCITSAYLFDQLPIVPVLLVKPVVNRKNYPSFAAWGVKKSRVRCYSLKKVGSHILWHTNEHSPVRAEVTDH